MRMHDRIAGRNAFRRHNGIDPWGDTAKRAKTVFGITCQFCGFVFGLLGVLSFVLLLAAMTGVV